jgi:hypothetical protein
MGHGTELVFVTIHIDTYRPTGLALQRSPDCRVYNGPVIAPQEKRAGNGAVSNPESEDPISDSYWVNRGFAHLNSLEKDPVI